MGNSRTAPRRMAGRQFRARKSRSPVDPTGSVRSKLTINAFVLALVIPLAAMTAGADVHLFSASLDGQQANAGAGTGSPGTGSAAVTFDDATNLLSWEVTWSGLVGAVTAAHFHGPAPPGANAGVRVGISAASPSIGSATISSDDADTLLAGLMYLNVHSTVNPGGEIRGQVLAMSATTTIVTSTTSTTTTIAPTTTTTTSTTIPPTTTSTTTAPGICGQPTSAGTAPTATDCLFILQASVFIQTCDPAPCICAPKGSLPVSATDALICLKRATGQEVAMTCPC